MFGQDNTQDQNPWLNNPDTQFNPTSPQQDQAPVDNGSVGAAPMPDPITPQTDLSAPVVADSPTQDHTAAAGGTSNDELLQIKQDALQQLSPLVNQLELSPEEKFRTTMMMIQAADDHSLLSQAYETAKQIGDEKLRAQALLDVINEINYFTQQQKS